VNDTWDLQCFGHPYPQTLLFNETADNGNLRGYVPTTLIPFLPKGILSDYVFADTVVDYKSGPDGWLLELQCVEALGSVKFVGINMYAKLKTMAAFDEMYECKALGTLACEPHGLPERAARAERRGLLDLAREKYARSGQRHQIAVGGLECALHARLILCT